MPMFASNQVFQISGELNQLETTLNFAMRHSGFHEVLTRKENPRPLAFTTANSTYYLTKGQSPGWQTYPFEYDPKIVAQIIQQYIEEQPRPFCEFDGADGAHKLGFICKHITALDALNSGIQAPPFSKIIAFAPYINFYSK